MATGLKSRVIYREKLSSASGDYWVGTYKLLIKAKSIPSPIGAKNMEDTSTLEDLIETREEGRASANDMEIQGAFEKKFKDELTALEGKVLDIIILYGTDGKGSEGMLAFQGTESWRPDEATEGHLTGTATVVQKTVPRWIDDKYEVTVEEDELGEPTSFTIAKKSL